MPFEKNVFINCPFDQDYRILLKPMIFEILYLGFKPQLSQTISSSNIRINEIKKIIANCKYGIHDLSRSKPLKNDDLPRFNMPYELGLDIGALEYGNRKLKTKKILILETERFHFQKVISDIAGQDIENHSDDPYTLITKVRNWFSLNFQDFHLVGPAAIWIAYNQFINDLTSELRNEEYSDREIDEIPIGDFLKFARDWIYSFLS